MIDGLVERPLYMKSIERFLETPEIKVLIGVRRCGKSSLLSLLDARLIQQKGIPKHNVISLKLDSYEVPLNPDDLWLSSTLEACLKKANDDKPVFILLDEVQEVQGWENVVRKLNTRPNTNIFITGSNSKVLSGDLATFLAGRYIEIPVHPLNFDEYKLFATASGWDVSNEERLFDDFMTYGSMPALFYHLQADEDAFYKVLSSITDTVVLKDVIARHGVKDTDLLNRVIRYIFSTSGNLLSTKKIVDTLTSSGRKCSQETIDNYINALVSSKILTPCVQGGVGGKQVLRPQKKYYVVDTGLRNMTVGFNKTKDLGFQFEGVVHNELIALGWNLSTIRNLKDEEVDFLATRNDEKMYVQVALSVLDDATFNRELTPLASLKDSFPKYIVVKDHNRLGITEEGIKIVNIIDWLKTLDLAHV